MFAESGYVSCLFVKWGPRTDTGVGQKHTVSSERFSQDTICPLALRLSAVFQHQEVGCPGNGSKAL